MKEHSKTTNRSRGVKVGLIDAEKEDTGLVLENPDRETAETVFEMFKESFETIKKEWHERS